MGQFVSSSRCCGTMRLIQCSCLLLALHLTQGQRGGIFSFFGNLFRPRRPNNQGGVPVISPQGFRIRPLITLDERPRNVAAASNNRLQEMEAWSLFLQPPIHQQQAAGAFSGPATSADKTSIAKGTRTVFAETEKESALGLCATRTGTAMTSRFVATKSAASSQAGGNRMTTLR